MQTVDRVVLSTLCGKVFIDDRVMKMLHLGRDYRKGTSQEQKTFLWELASELEMNRRATERLYEAVESGLPLAVARSREWCTGYGLGGRRS